MRMHRGPPVQEQFSTLCTQPTGCKSPRTGSGQLSHGATLISSPPAVFKNATNHCRLLRAMEEARALLLERRGEQVPLRGRQVGGTAHVPGWRKDEAPHPGPADTTAPDPVGPREPEEGRPSGSTYREIGEGYTCGGKEQSSAHRGPSAQLGRGWAPHLPYGGGQAPTVSDPGLPFAGWPGQKRSQVRKYLSTALPPSQEKPLRKD